MKRRFNSLAARLLLASALLLPLFLGVSGWYLERSHRLGIEAGQQERLYLQVLALLAQAEFDAGLSLPGQLVEPRLDQPNSGLYAFVTDAQGQLLWASPSAVSLDPAEIFASIPHLAAGSRYSAISNGLLHLSLQVLWEADAELDVPLRFTVVETTAPIEAQVGQHRRYLLFWLGGSAVLLLACQVAILVWGLRPLRELAADIARVESGAAGALQRSYPREVQALTDNLNALLVSEQLRRERARQTLSDLAHSLKTPLAVIRNASPEDADYGLLVREQSDRMEQIVSYQLQRASSAGHRLLQTVAVDPVLQRLRASLLKVYAGRELTIELQVAPGCRFRGDERDLLEILGNLLDNACKYGRSRVRVRVSASGGGGPALQIAVEDDGPGIPEQLRDVIVRRGVRADSRREGQGLGLSVAVDIAASYRGSLSIEPSELGGARLCLRFSDSKPGRPGAP